MFYLSGGCYTDQKWWIANGGSRKNSDVESVDHEMRGTMGILSVVHFEKKNVSRPFKPESRVAWMARSVIDKLYHV